MKKIFIKKFVEIALITLLFLGCVTEAPPATTPSSTTPTPTTAPATTSPAQFEITDLRVIPENPKVGDTLTILVDVQNKGDSSGSYTILVTIGSKSKTQNIELEGKSSKTVQFQETADTEGDIEIKAGNLTKTISVAPLETTTPPPTTAPSTTPAPTTAPPSTEPKGEKIYRPEYELGTRLNYLYTVGGNEWGCTIAYNSPRQGDRTPWFRWGVTDFWNANPKATYWRGDYTYIYDSNWNLRGVLSDAIGGNKFSNNIYLCDYQNPDLPCIYPLVKGAEKIHSGQLQTLMVDWTIVGGSAAEGRGTYERRIYTEGFEDIEAGGKTYRCARVKYYMRHTVTFLSPHDNEDWGKIEWIEEGYHWYSDIGMVKTEVTIKTYWWDELEKTDKVYIILTGATLP
jgi:hypothetical protein